MEHTSAKLEALNSGTCLGYLRQDVAKVETSDPFIVYITHF